MSLWRRLRWWIAHRRNEEDLAAELEFHEAMKAAEVKQRGVPGHERRRVERREMGNVSYLREEARAVWVWPWLERLVQDVRYAFRSARRRPAFALGVIAITALGVGATTAIFSVVDGIILRRLPYPDADRLVYFDLAGHSPPRFRDWQREIRAIDAWAGVWSQDLDLVGEGRPERVSAARISPRFFELFGGRPVAGRLFSSADYVAPGDAAVIS